jgi:hypothetical protein
VDAQYKSVDEMQVQPAVPSPRLLPSRNFERLEDAWKTANLKETHAIYGRGNVTSDYVKDVDEDYTEMFSSSKLNQIQDNVTLLSSSSSSSTMMLLLDEEAKQPDYEDLTFSQVNIQPSLPRLHLTCSGVG